MTTPATELDPVLQGALTLLRDKPSVTLTALSEAVVPPPEHVPAAEAVPFPELPAPIPMTAEALAALRRLPKIFGGFDLDERRALTQDELGLLMDETSVISQIAAVLGPRLEQIKETVRVHMDAEAEKSGAAIPADVFGPDGTVIQAATPRDQNGHYLLARPKQGHQVPAGLMAWVQEYRSGSAVPSDDELAAAYENGDITREEYLAFTEPVRAFSPDKARGFIRRNPARGLAILRRITRRKPPTSALAVRKAS